VPGCERLAVGVAETALTSRLTSGSTGQPFRVSRTRTEEWILGAIRARGNFASGLTPRDRVVVLQEGSFVGTRRLPGRVAQRLGLFRGMVVDPSRPPEAVAAALVALAPDVVAGYTSALAGVARKLGGDWGGATPLRTVRSGGEVLSPVVRRRIEAGFGAPVRDHYGAFEFNQLATECRDGSGLMHLNELGSILEVLEDGQPVGVGERGEVVITGLHSYAMPFLRYRNGDLAVRGPSPCACGWPGSTIESIDGRVVEHFLLPRGRWLHPVCIIGPMLKLELAWVERHQVVQERENVVVMRIEPLRPPLAHEVHALETIGREVLGSEVRFRVELVDDLAPAPGQKSRPFVSLSAPPYPLV
jgi:phenylacetate-CoA ligase